jgi:hypothetical protein
MAQKVKSQRKFGKKKRKAAARTNPISLFVRDRISAADYFKLTNQGVKS